MYQMTPKDSKSTLTISFNATFLNIHLDDVMSQNNILFSDH